MLITSPERDPGNTPTVTTLTTPEAAQPLVAEFPLPEEVTERYLEIRTVPEQQVITVMKKLCRLPISSRVKDVRSTRANGSRVLGSATHLIEIDLLRSGHPFPVKALGHNDYRIVISRSQHRPRADIKHPLGCAT